MCFISLKVALGITFGDYNARLPIFVCECKNYYLALRKPAELTIWRSNPSQLFFCHQPVSTNMRISLEPVTDPKEAQSFSLGEQIRRITQEKGSFSHLTEESLAKEIQSPSDSSELAQEDDSTDEPRQKLVAAVRTALNESALSLDFVSLLISGLRPQSGASSMSPALKRQVPIGTLGCDTIKTEQISINKDKPGAGWKLIALQNASKYLQDASVRLKGEAEKEARFWNQLLDTVKAGEVIVKTGRGKMRGLNVKFGFADSGSSYFEAGTGKLLRGEDGSAVFKPKSAIEKKVVRVTSYSSDDQVIGCGFVECKSDKELSTARNYLFEEELFFQLQQEARSLGSHRVSLTHDRIVCELFEGRLEIDLVDEDVASNEEIPKDKQAQLICHLLHLLLCYYFAQTLEKRQSVPEPLDSTKSTNESHVLNVLRPVLAHMQHAKLSARAVRLAEMVIANSSIETAKQTVDGGLADLIFTSPETRVHITSAETQLELLVRSPLTSDEATFQAICGNSTGEFYDLTELEIWLKGVALA